MRQTWLRAAVLVLTLVLASSPVFAGSRTVNRSAASEISGVLATVWQALRGLLPALGQDAAGPETNDPNAAATPPGLEDPGSDSDRGPGADPWG